jgi:hypothetical protein
MFEDKKRKKTRRFIGIVFLVVIVASFAVGYYMNMEPTQNADSENSTENVGYAIPENLINPIGINDISTIVPQEAVGQMVNILDTNVVGANTEFVLKTTYLKCGHSLERKAIPRANEINMNETDLANCYNDWLLESFSKDIVVFKRELNTHCPNHYIIGIYGGNIAIFVYNQDGERILKEETDISISTFTPEDQYSLQQGIIADTEEELNMKLEGFSD